MRVYLAEEKGEPIGVFASRDEAAKWIRDGTITVLELNTAYPEGIGLCEHWHFENGVAVAYSLPVKRES